MKMTVIADTLLVLCARDKCKIFTFPLEYSIIEG